jgi:two-component system, cell cycle sensor histidine kinase and response regulator CckA
MPEAETPSSRVLVLDDEKALRLMLQEILGLKGFPCEAASNVQDALALWRQEMSGTSPFRLALVDLTLGDGPGGVDFAREVRKLDPNALLIACSGDSTDPAMADPIRNGFDATLTKPFLFGALLETLARVLGGQTANDDSSAGLRQEANHAKLFRLGDLP